MLFFQEPPCPSPEEKEEVPEEHIDDDIDKYLASTSTANTANSTTGARSLSLTPSSVHGVSQKKISGPFHDAFWDFCTGGHVGR